MALDESDHKSLVLWATECAGHVLPNFEEKYPNDYRPRDALDAGRAWARGEITVSEARAAGHAAATAHVASHAAAAANYAVSAADSGAKERDRQYRRLPRHLRPVVFPAQGNN